MNIYIMNDMLYKFNKTILLIFIIIFLIFSLLLLLKLINYVYNLNKYKIKFNKIKKYNKTNKLKIKKNKIISNNLINNFIENIKYLDDKNINLILVACSYNGHFIPNWYSKTNFQNIFNISDDDWEKIQYDYKIINEIEYVIKKWCNKYYNNNLDTESNNSDENSNEELDEESNNSDKELDEESNNSDKESNNSDKESNNSDKELDEELNNSNDELDEELNSSNEELDEESNNSDEELNKNIDNNLNDDLDKYLNTEKSEDEFSISIDDIKKYLSITNINNINKIVEECSKYILIPSWYTKESIEDISNKELSEETWHKVLYDESIGYTLRSSFIECINTELNIYKSK